MKARLYEDSDGGLWLVVSTTPRGGGYMRPIWTNRAVGPGNATEPGRDCGHTGLDHCNSIHCRRWFCRLPRTKLGRLLLQGHTLRVYLTPAPRLHRRLEGEGLLACARRYLKRRRVQLHAMGLKLATHPHMADLYGRWSVR